MGAIRSAGKRGLCMLRAAFYTLGCKVNQYESNAMMSAFEQAGFTIVEPEEEADVYVINSCTVTATGDKKSRQALRRFRRQSPLAVLVLCGCFPQAFPEEASLIPEADIVMGSKNRRDVLQAVLDRLAGGERVVKILPHTAGEPFEPMKIGGFHSRTRAFLKIQDGCERRCSYCIIPDARGPIRSKPLQDIQEELAALGAQGYREVVLVGINLSCYGLDLGLSLTDALEVACHTPGISRVRLGSLEPELLTDEMMEQWKKLPGLCPQFHLSLQSGCDATLRRMNRHYDTAEYRRIAAGLRKAFPGCALTTDVMVAFPGETEEEYEASEAFVREMNFARTHVFVYSPRKGTPAALMPQVDKQVASRRAKRMAQAAEDCRTRFLQEQLGTEQPVLWENRDSNGLWQGYTPNYTQVYLDSDRELHRQIVVVKLTELYQDGCMGRLAE